MPKIEVLYSGQRPQVNVEEWKRRKDAMRRRAISYAAPVTPPPVSEKIFDESFDATFE